MECGHHKIQEWRCQESGKYPSPPSDCGATLGLLVCSVAGWRWTGWRMDPGSSARTSRRAIFRAVNHLGNVSHPTVTCDRLDACPGTQEQRARMTHTTCSYSLTYDGIPNTEDVEKPERENDGPNSLKPSLKLSNKLQKSNTFRPDSLQSEEGVVQSFNP